MRPTVFLPATLLCAALVCAPPPSRAAVDFAELWDEAVPLLGEGMEIIASGKNPDSRSLGELLTFRDSKFQRLVEECFAVLADSSTLDLIRQRDKVQKQIAAKRRKIAELQKAAISAPTKHWNPLKATQESLREDVRELREDIAELESELEAGKEQAFAAITAKGLPVTRDQLETLLISADGTDTASIMAVAENIKAIHENIAAKLPSPDTSLEMLQGYTGLHMMCNKVYAYALQHALMQIDERYLVGLETIRDEAGELLRNARNMLSGASAADRKILETNIGANQRTINAVELYTRYFKQRKAELQRLLEQAEKTFAVSVNTYRTVKTGTDLLGMMRGSEKDFARIFAFQPPELSLLYDDRLRQEFEDISRRLQLEK